MTLLAGIASTTQGTFNGYWKERLDLNTILLANTLVVLACVLLLMLLTPSSDFKVPYEKINWSLAVGGISGFFVIMIFAIAFPSIGALKTILLFVFGQILAALLFDHFGLLNLKVSPIDIQKIAGMILVLMGVYLVFDK